MGTSSRLSAGSVISGCRRNECNRRNGIYFTAQQIVYPKKRMPSISNVMSTV